MNLKELDSFSIADAISFHDELNSNLWDGQHLRPEVKDQLLYIAKDFLEELGVDDLDVVDITVSGSNAAYSYTPHSDLDLHILVDLSKLDNNEIYRELFNAKKNIYNDTHNITVHGVPVELYVQDAREPVVSLGEYSILNDKWLRIPTKRRANLDQTATKQKYEKLHKVITKTLQTKNILQVSKVLQKIKQYRQAGLDKGGEFGPENLAYKILRKQGLIDKLYDLRDKLHSEELTIETSNKANVKVRKNTLADKLADEFRQYQTTDEDYDPNGVPPGPEFKPTMPAGTVRVDVSDVYDWYKLGQHISDLEHTDPKMFGKGPPSTIMAFGSEPEEHKYINRLQNIGLTTTDIDPLDPKQPKGLPRQSVDTTYNVNETSDEEIHNYTKLDNILKKLCGMIVKGQQKDSEYYGMVAAAVLDPDNNIVAGVNRYGSNGKRVHAERVAIEKYQKKYGSVPEGSIVITTLSPCNESDDETAQGRIGESCTDYLNSKGIEKVYCGYIDPTQDNNQRQFNMMETGNQDIRRVCKSFADTFLDIEPVEEDSYAMYPNEFSAEKTLPVTPYGNKEREFRGSIAEAFDQPYKLKWEEGDYGDIDAYAKLPDGNYLSIMFNKGYNKDNEEAWSVEFFRNNSQEVTGEGDAQRVFATVLGAIQKFIKKYKPNRIIFSASKEVEPGQNAQSRARLYDSLVQRYAKAWGFKAFRADTGNKVIYELNRINKDVAEARTNPEQNIKYGSGKYELIGFAEDIRDKDNWAVSMTMEPKLGINPQAAVSEDTPKGIYFYPLRYFIQMADHRKELPWGDNFPYMQLFQYDRSGEMTKHTKVDPAKLKQALLQYCPEEVIQQASEEGDYDGTPYWFIYDCLSRLGKSDETNVVRWNKVLRDLGFTSVYDDGAGWIAYNEPTQGVVLDPRIIKQHKMFVNRNPTSQHRRYDIQRLADSIRWSSYYQSELQHNRIRTWDIPAEEQKVRLEVAKTMLKPFLGKSKEEAEAMGYKQALTAAADKVIEILKQPINEASGYIPSEKEKNDPRFKTALTVDVKPDSIKKNAKAFSWLTSRAGIPPTAKPNGTI